MAEEEQVEKNLSNLTEEEMRDFHVKYPKTLEEVMDILKTLTERDQDYGTCVYSMSIAAVAAYNYVAQLLGVTGFQASCADLDIIKRTRGYKDGFMILDYSNLLYPQYRENFTLTPEKIIRQNLDHYRTLANKFLEEKDQYVHPKVKAYWEYVRAIGTINEDSCWNRFANES